MILKRGPLLDLFNAMLHGRMISEQLQKICSQPELAEMWKSVEIRKPNNFYNHGKLFKGFLYGYNKELNEHVFVSMWDTKDDKPVVKYVLFGTTERCDCNVPIDDIYVGNIMQFGNRMYPTKTLLFKTTDGKYYIKELRITKDKINIVPGKIAYKKVNDNPLDLLEGRWVVRDTSNPHVRVMVCKSWKIFYIRRENKGSYYVSKKCLVNCKK